MTSISMEDDMDLSMRAPYISMSEADDLPLLISEDLMWGALPCDAPTMNKYGHESKLNVVVDVAAMQLPPTSNISNPQTLFATVIRDSVDPGLVLQQQEGGRRRKASGDNLVDERKLKQQRSNVNGQAAVNHLLLQSSSVDEMETGRMNSNSASCSSGSEDTNHSDIIEPLFDDTMAKNCECGRIYWIDTATEGRY